MHNRHDQMEATPLNRHNHTNGSAEKGLLVKNLREGPVDLKLGPREGIGAATLEIIDPIRDLPADELAMWRDRIDLTHQYFVTDPSLRDATNLRGIKALRDKESIVLGRENTYNNRFDFNELVSRSHVRITREGDRVYIEDLNSLNGTHDVGHSALRSLGIRQPHHREHVSAPEHLGVKAEVTTLAHEKHADRNEDNYFLNETSRAAGVFDGMGGHKGSELASQIAAQSIDKHLDNLPPSMAPDTAMAQLREAVIDAHLDIEDYVEAIPVPESEKEELRRIGTTATVARVFEDEHGRSFVAIASVGDSRAYLERNDQLEMLTLDQATYIREAGSPEAMLARQEKFSNMTGLDELTPVEQALYRFRSEIYGALGPGGKVGKDTVQTTFRYLQPGDKILLATDGIHDNLTTDEIEDIFRMSNIPSARLAQEAQLRSREKHVRAKSDDMTAVVMSFDKA